MALLPLPLAGATLSYDASWLGAAEADSLLDLLHAEIPWERHRIRIFGREVDSPRLSCWIGDPGASYTYSRTRFEPHPWSPALADLRTRVEATTGCAFNSVLANLYRDGADGMGWHSDDEPELGHAPSIASVSLGAPRRFQLRHRSDPAQRATLTLAHGSLLLMQGTTQANYRHALPKTTRPVAPRLNLTFRLVHPL